MALVGIHAWWDPPDPRPSRALPSVQTGTRCLCVYARPRAGRLLLMVCVVVSSVLSGTARSMPIQSASASTIGSASAPASTAGSAGGVRTGVLIHGCHLGAKRWRSIMWGDEQQQRLGR